jgi:cbb3-type cytochrome oxidase subunit 3
MIGEMKKFLFLAVVFCLLIFSIGLVLYFFSPQAKKTLTQTIPQQIRQKEQTQTSSFENTPASGVQITKVPLEKSAVMYQIRGVFVKDLEFKFGSLYGEFLISGTVDKTPIPIFLSGEKGQMNFGMTEKDKVVWNMTSSQIIKEKVKANVPVELRLSTADLDAQSKASGVILEKILTEKKVPKDTVLIPQMLRLL